MTQTLNEPTQFVRWTYCVIKQSPTAPAKENELQYTVLLHREGGLPLEITGKTSLEMWPDFICEPKDPADPEQSVWPVLWIGRRYYLWIVHRPVAEECP